VCAGLCGIFKVFGSRTDSGGNGGHEKTRLWTNKRHSPLFGRCQSTLIFFFSLVSFLGWPVLPLRKETSFFRRRLIHHSDWCSKLIPWLSCLLFSFVCVRLEKGEKKPGAKNFCRFFFFVSNRWKRSDNNILLVRIRNGRKATNRAPFYIHLFSTLFFLSSRLCGALVL
jgi:hypothetical protein